MEAMVDTLRREVAEKIDIVSVQPYMIKTDKALGLCEDVDQRWTPEKEALYGGLKPSVLSIHRKLCSPFSVLAVRDVAVRVGQICSLPSSRASRYPIGTWGGWFVACLGTYISDLSLKALGWVATKQGY